MKIVAIGGGEISQGETDKIDRFIIDFVGVEQPKLLFVPTASHDNEHYISFIEEYFGDLNCRVDSLNLVAESLTASEIRDKILRADIIYVGGGDTAYMMGVWQDHKLGDCIQEAIDQGVVLAGLSAGAICWFEGGYYDASNQNGYWDKEPVKGLGLIEGVLCPHYNYERDGRFEDFLRDHKSSGLALDDQTAYVVDDNESYSIKNNSDMKAVKLICTSGSLIEEDLEEKNI